MSAAPGLFVAPAPPGASASVDGQTAAALAAIAARLGFGTLQTRNCPLLDHRPVHAVDIVAGLREAASLGGGRLGNDEISRIAECSLGIRGLDREPLDDEDFHLINVAQLHAALTAAATHQVTAG